MTSMNFADVIYALFFFIFYLNPPDLQPSQMCLAALKVLVGMKAAAPGRDGN